MVVDDGHRVELAHEFGVLQRIGAVRVADDAQTALAPHQGLGTLVVDEDVVARFVDVVFDEGRRQALLPVQQNEAGTAHDLRELGDTDAGPDGVEVGEPMP